MTYAAIIEGKITEKGVIIVITVVTFNLLSRQWLLYFRIFHEKLIFWRRQALSREEAWGWGRGWGSGSYSESSYKTDGLTPCWCSMCWYFSFPVFFCVLFLSLQVKLTFESESPELTDWSQAGLTCIQQTCETTEGASLAGNHSALEMPLT